MGVTFLLTASVSQLRRNEMHSPFPDPLGNERSGGPGRGWGMGVVAGLFVRPHPSPRLTRTQSDPGLALVPPRPQLLPTPPVQEHDTS